MTGGGVQGILEGCLGMFSGQGHEAHQGAMYRLLARGLRGMRGGDLSRNEQLAHNVGIACMLIVNHTRVRAAAISVVVLMLRMCRARRARFRKKYC